MPTTPKGEIVVSSGVCVIVVGTNVVAMLWVGNNHWSVKGRYLKGWFVKRMMNYDWKVWIFAELGLILERLSCVDMMLGESLESVSEDAANLNSTLSEMKVMTRVD